MTRNQQGFLSAARHTGRVIGPVVCLAICLAASSQVGADPAPEAIDAVFAEYDSTNSPGCALGVYRGGEVAYSRGYGMANLEYGIAITPRTVFRIGSTSKQFSAMALAILAEQGELDLDDDIRGLFPEFADYGATVTYRQLAHHTSGLRDYLTLAVLAEWPMHFSVADTLAMIARQRGLNFEPGTRWIYSNTNYFLISQIVERVTGQGLRAWAEEHMFGPLGMANSHFHDDHRHIVPLRADGYGPRLAGGFQINMTTLDHVGDGGVYTTVEDFRRWHDNFDDNRLGRGDDALIELVTTPARLEDGSDTGYGFGLSVGTYRGVPIIRHGGAFVGFRATSSRFPDHDLGLAVFCNVSTANPNGLADQVADLYLGDVLEPVPAPPVATADSASEEVEPEQDLAPFTGSYWDPAAKVHRRVTIDDGRLHYERGPENRSPLRAIGEGRFLMLEVPGRVAVDFGVGTMTVTVPDRDPIVFDAYEPHRPTPEELAALPATYYSAELDYALALKVEEGRLVAARGDGEAVLEPRMEGVFQGGFTTLTFVRDEAGAVEAFLLDAGRVRDLRYERR